MQKIIFCYGNTSNVAKVPSSADLAGQGAAHDVVVVPRPDDVGVHVDAPVAVDRGAEKVEKVALVHQQGVVHLCHILVFFARYFLHGFHVLSPLVMLDLSLPTNQDLFSLSKWSFLCLFLLFYF